MEYSHEVRFKIWGMSVNDSFGIVAILSESVTFTQDYYGRAGDQSDSLGTKEVLAAEAFLLKKFPTY